MPLFVSQSVPPCRWITAAAVWISILAFRPLVGVSAAEPVVSNGKTGSDEEMSAYRSTPATGSVAALQDRIAKGGTSLEFSASHGYLPALLRELKVPAASQLLVASKTSPNKNYISPKNPRALYFNDEVALAYVPGADLIEVAAADKKLGVVFYTVEQKASGKPSLVRDDRCLECHVSAKTLNTPGWLIRSFLTRGDGEVDLLSGLMVTHRTPIADRWGGYYVTGDTGGQMHRGNLFGPEAFARHEKGTWTPPVMTDLKTQLDVAKFPESGSDVVPLLVLEHQVHMMNLLTHLRFESEAVGEGDSLQRTHAATEAVLKYMLFVEEAPLGAPVRGSGGFTRQFEAAGPADAQGRSFRQFDLKTRLFKYPCSFMVYSPSFEGLPPRATKHLYRRLWDILAGDDKSTAFQKLSAGDRVVIRDILLQTKKDLPAYWRL